MIKGTDFIKPPKIDTGILRRFRVRHTLEIRVWLIIFVVLMAVLITKVIQDNRQIQPPIVVENLLDTQTILSWFNCEIETGESYNMCIADREYARYIIEDVMGE